MNEVLKNSEGNILNPKIPRYEKEKEYILATITSTQKIGSNYIVNLQSVESSSGNKLMLATEGTNKGKVVIGAGVSKIKVSGAIFVDNWSGISNYLWGIIKKNNKTLTGNIAGSGSSFVSASMSTTIAEVQEGDVIYLMADSSNGGTLRAGAASTWLLVEVFE